MKKRVLPALAVALTLAAGGPSWAAEAAITIKEYGFKPNVLVVAKGTKVTWTNEDDIPHNIVGAGSLFRSAALDTKDSFSFTFENAGSYTYFCQLHPFMTGKVVVNP